MYVNMLINIMESTNENNNNNNNNNTNIHVHHIETSDKYSLQFVVEMIKSIIIIINIIIMLWWMGYLLIGSDITSSCLVLWSLL